MKTSSALPRSAATFFLCVGALFGFVGCGDNPSSTAPEFRKPSVVGLSLDPAQADLAIGRSLTIRVSLNDSGLALDPLTAELVSWESDNPSIAFVDAGGVVTAMESGIAVISAHYDGRVGYSFVTVGDTPAGKSQRKW